MADYEVHVDGSTGSPVLLLAGGASSSRGFFPGLVDALPGHRVISLDRPGTGRAAGRGSASLPSGSAAAAEVIRELGAGPAVVVGQSLGGAQAVQLVVDHPELVAGLVLIDPTPIDIPGLVPTLRRVTSVLALPGRLPLIGASLERGAWKVLGAGTQVAEDAREAFEVMKRSASIHTLGKALATLEEDAHALAPRVRKLDVPAVLMTADRKPGHKVRLSHERLAAALGARLVAPPKAIHAEHLRDPKGVNQLVAGVVAEAQTERA